MKYKTVRHGNLRIHNVPHTPYPRGIGPDGETEYIDAGVMYKLSFIVWRMSDEGLSECDYAEESVEE